jgi:hypothetical protein
MMKWLLPAISLLAIHSADASQDFLYLSQCTRAYEDMAFINCPNAQQSGTRNLAQIYGDALVQVSYESARIYAGPTTDVLNCFMSISGYDSSHNPITVNGGKLDVVLTPDDKKIDVINFSPIPVAGLYTIDKQEITGNFSLNNDTTVLFKDNTCPNSG